MDALKMDLVLAAAKAQPKMFSAIAACIDVGGTKEEIMKKVNSIAPAWGVTAGLCDAVCDFFQSEAGESTIRKAKERYFSKNKIS